MDEFDVLRAGYGATLSLVDGLGADDLSRPTPCAEWDVRALLSHVVTSTDGLVALLHDEQPDWESDRLGDDPAASVRRSLTASLEAWAAPGALERPSSQLPGMRVVDFAMGDALAHAWDLAAALDRPRPLDDDLVRLVLDRWAGGAAEQGRAWGVFGPRVEVGDDAPVLEQLVALFGRDPRAAPAVT